MKNCPNQMQHLVRIKHYINRVMKHLVCEKNSYKNTF